MKVRTCKSCGKEFIPTHGNQKNCPACRMPKTERKKYTRKNILKTQTCPVCGKSFETQFTKKVYCSEKCRKKNAKKRQKDYEKATNIPVEEEKKILKPCMSLEKKSVIAKSYGLTYGKLDGLLAAKGLSWRDHKKLGLQRSE